MHCRAWQAHLVAQCALSTQCADVRCQWYSLQGSVPKNVPKETSVRGIPTLPGVANLPSLILFYSFVTCVGKWWVLDSNFYISVWTCCVRGCGSFARDAVVHLSCSTREYSGVFDFSLSHTFLFAHLQLLSLNPFWGLSHSRFCSSCVCCNLPIFGALHSWTMLFVLVRVWDQNNQNTLFLHILHFIFPAVAQIFLPCFLPCFTLPFVFTIVSSACTRCFLLNAAVVSMVCTANS